MFCAVHYGYFDYVVLFFSRSVFIVLYMFSALVQMKYWKDSSLK